MSDHQQPVPPKATLRAILRQTYLDWFTTKDVQETPTVTYVWTADQFGHFGLGFLPTLVFAWIATWSFGVNETEWDLFGLAVVPRINFLVGIAIGVFCFWIGKELVDYRSEVKRATQAKSSFPFNSKEIWWNVFTAWIFFAMGSFVAGLSFLHPKFPLYALVILLPVTVGVSIWWLRRKLTFQQAGLPYLYRLANFPNFLSSDPATAKSVVEFVLKMIDPKPQVTKQLIISGKSNSGRSPLAVGIGTEFAFKLGIARYTSLTTLLALHDKEKAAWAADSTTADPTTRYAKKPETDKEFNDGRILWPWETAQLLIVDDVDQVLGILPTGTSSEDCVRMLSEKLRNEYGDLLTKLAKIPRIVWVLSDRLRPDHFQALVEALAKAFHAGPMETHVVLLEKTLPQAKREKNIAPE